MPAKAGFELQHALGTLKAATQRHSIDRQKEDVIDSRGKGIGQASLIIRRVRQHREITERKAGGRAHNSAEINATAVRKVTRAKDDLRMKIAKKQQGLRLIIRKDRLETQIGKQVEKRLSLISIGMDEQYSG